MSKRDNMAVGHSSEKQTKRAGRKPRNTAGSEIFELKITLRGTRPPIWRRLAVASDITLAEFHDVIQAVMGWYGEHLYQFIDKNETRYGSDFLADDDPDVVAANRVRLRDLVDHVGSRLLYEYDFGDGWQHQVEVVSIGPPQPATKYPTCLAGKRACPPEDCGGVGGYDCLLEIIADSNHEEHEERLEWLGDDFDPEDFDIDEVNAILADD